MKPKEEEVAIALMVSSELDSDDEPLVMYIYKGITFILSAQLHGRQAPYKLMHGETLFGL